jgi:starch-binding outer membrane protein, SusD/RagB family
MKLIKIFSSLLLIAFVTITVTGCKKVLEQTPQDRIDVELFFKTRNDAEAALNGAYQSVFADLIPAYYLNNTLAAREIEQFDDITARAIQYRPSLRIDNDGGVGSLWISSYRALARINLLLEKLPTMPNDLFFERNMPAGRDRKKEVEGEAKFLRAFIYYNLVINWGDVPLIVSFPTSGSPGDNQTPRTPAADVWIQIKKDLADAESFLPVNHNFYAANLSAGTQRLYSKGKATKGIAQLMLARIAVRERNWQVAADKANEIINNGQFTITPNYASIFINTPITTSQNSTESILEIQSVANGFNNTGGLGPWEFVGIGRTKVTDTLRNFYQGGMAIDNPFDIRMLYSFNYSYNTDRTLRGIGMIKYYNRDGTSPYNSGDPFNFVLGRLSEAYLIRAEALNELSYPNNAALSLINNLRARAQNSAANNYPVVIRRPNRPDTTVLAKGIPPASFTTGVNVEPVTTQAAFRRLIRGEYQRELAFEGHMWYNILRWDLQDNTQNALWYVYLNQNLPGGNVGKILLPIPQSEILVNTALRQNTGY